MSRCPRRGPVRSLSAESLRNRLLRARFGKAVSRAILGRLFLRRASVKGAEARGRAPAPPPGFAAAARFLCSRRARSAAFHGYERFGPYRTPRANAIAPAGGMKAGAFLPIPRDAALERGGWLRRIVHIREKLPPTLACFPKSLFGIGVCALQIICPHVARALCKGKPAGGLGLWALRTVSHMSFDWVTSPGCGATRLPGI